MKKIYYLSVLLLVLSCGKDDTVTPDHLVPGSDPSSNSTEIFDQSGMSTLQHDMLVATNEIRKQGCSCNGTQMPPVGELFWHPMLEESAVGHSEDMDKNDYISHTSLDGRSFTERMEDTGYVWTFGGENIAKGPVTVADAMNAFLGSESHCKTLMNGNYNEMGTGKFGKYWTINFGKR